MFIKYGNPIKCVFLIKEPYQKGKQKKFFSGAQRILFIFCNKMSSSLKKQDKTGKKGRSTNFDASETSLLVNLVSKNKDILFNKETNKVHNDMKNKTWELVTEEYNAINPRQIERTKDSLVGLWKKTKRNARTNKAVNKVIHCNIFSFFFIDFCLFSSGKHSLQEVDRQRRKRSGQNNR